MIRTICTVRIAGDSDDLEESLAIVMPLMACIEDPPYVFYKESVLVSEGRKWSQDRIAFYLLSSKP